MKKYNILIAILKTPPFVGGAENLAWELAKQLNKHPELNISVLTTNSSDSEYVQEGIKVYSFNVKEPYTFYYEVFFKKKIYDLIKDKKFDLVNVHGSLPYGYLLRNLDIPKIITTHGMERPQGNKFRKYNMLRTYLISSALKKSDKVVSPGRVFASYMVKRYKIKPIQIPNGIDTNKFKFKNKKRKEKTILFVGRFMAGKGINLLLEMAKIMPDFKFLFAGSGYMEDKINLPNTKVLGKLNHKDLIDYYNTVEFCVFPSLFENLPMVALESMACGNIVIANKPGYEEIIESGKDGVIVKDYNARSYKLEILKLKQENKLDLMRKKAREKALRYDLSIIAKEYHDLFMTFLE